MKHRLAFALPPMLLLGACVTPVEKPVYYTLSVQAQPSATPTDLGPLIVGPVQVPQMLDRPRIVMRLNPQRVTFSDHAQWAGSLEEEIQGALANNLALRLGSEQVSLHPRLAQTPDAWRLRVQVLDLSGAPGDSARLHASWVLFNESARDRKTTQTEDLSRPVSGPGVDGLVGAYSALVAELAEIIAAQLRAGLR